MRKRVIIQLDGQNLFHSLKAIGLVENDIDWDKLLSDLVDPDDELIRTYIYRPRQLSHTSYSAEEHKWDYLKDHFRDNFDAAVKTMQGKLELPSALAKQIEVDYKEKKVWHDATVKQFDQTATKYSLMARDVNDLEVFKAGSLTIYPFKKALLGEKGVDVALSVKMVEFALLDKCDKLILFSGDYDYSEAIHVVKNAMKNVCVVRLKNADGKSVAMSEQLAEIADRVIEISENQLRTTYKKLSARKGN